MPATGDHAAAPSPGQREGFRRWRHLVVLAAERLTQERFDGAPGNDVTVACIPECGDLVSVVIPANRVDAAWQAAQRVWTAIRLADWHQGGELVKPKRRRATSRARIVVPLSREANREPLKIVHRPAPHRRTGIRVPCRVWKAETVPRCACVTMQAWSGQQKKTRGRDAPGSLYALPVVRRAAVGWHCRACLDPRGAAVAPATREGKTSRGRPLQRGERSDQTSAKDDPQTDENHAFPVYRAANPRTMNGHCPLR